MKLDTANEFDRNKAKTYFKRLLSDNKKIELKEVRNNRTIKHNAYLHVCVSLFSIEFGYTLDESKTLLKRECSFMIYEKNGLVFLKKTSKMQSDELSKFIEFIRNYSSKQGCYIPTSSEYLENKFNIDRQIDANSTFL